MLTLARPNVFRPVYDMVAESRDVRRIERYWTQNKETALGREADNTETSGEQRTYQQDSPWV